MAGEKATSFDIAALAGVSQSTVSRALRGDRSVSAETRARVSAIATQLHYTVDKNASSLRRGQSRTLALLFFDDPAPEQSVINPFFLSMLGSILKTCAREDYDLLTSFQQLSADWHVDYADSHKADGLILLGYGDYQRFAPRERQLQEQGTRFVRWGVPSSDDRGTTIGCDNVAGGRSAGEHLVARGRRRIAFLGDASPHYPEFRDRYLGLSAALAGAGLPPPPQVGALWSDEDGYLAARTLLARHPDVDAIFAASDMIAIGAMRALAEAGRTVPHAVAVVGFDDIPAAALAHPALTTVAQDYHRAGELLVTNLIRRIRGDAAGAMLLAPRLVVRESA